MQEKTSSILTIMPLGAGKEVGRSCVLMQYEGKQIMVKSIGILVRLWHTHE